MGNHHRFVYRVLKPGADTAFQQIGPPMDRIFQLLHKIRPDSLFLQIPGHRSGKTLGTRHHHAQISLMQIPVQLLPQQLQLPGPGGKLHTWYLHQFPQRNLRQRSAEGIQNHRGRAPCLGGQIRKICGEGITSFEKQSFLKELFDILLQLPSAVFQSFPDVDALAEHQKTFLLLPAAVQIAEQARRVGIEHRQIPVDGFQRHPALQSGDILIQTGAHHGGIFAPLVLAQLAQQLRHLLRTFKQYLSGWGNQNFLQRLLPPLGIDGEGVDAVDVIPPKLHPHRGLGLGRIEIQNPTPLGKLADAFHPLRPLVSGRHQEMKQPVHLHRLPGGQAHGGTL